MSPTPTYNLCQSEAMKEVVFLHLFVCCCPLQFDFPFIQTFRVSRFRFRPTSAFDDLAAAGVAGDSDLVEASSEVKINTERQLPDDLNHSASVWNCDGEVIDEPFIDFRSVLLHRL